MQPGDDNDVLEVGVECDDDSANAGLNEVEWILNHDVEDYVRKPANRRSGISLLTSMATYTGVGLGRQDDVVVVDVIQDQENDVVEYLKDDLEVVDGM